MSQWISVKESLPPPYNPALKQPQVYLCHVKDDQNVFGYSLMILGYGSFAWYDETYEATEADEDGMISRFGWHYERDSEGEYDSLIFDMNAKVTHWMPLPQPPEEA